MAIYLGNNKVSPTFNTVIERIITKDSGGNITSTSSNVNTNYTSEDLDDLSNNRDTNYTPWVRPTGWPNLDAINISDDFEGVYLTYDNNANLPYHIACFIVGGNTAKVETGYLDNNNVFIASTTTTVAKDTYLICDYSSMDSTTYPYVVFRITPNVATAHLTAVKFGRIPVANSGTIVAAAAYDNQCLERRGQLKWVTSLVNSSTNYCYCTKYMQKDATVVGINNAITGTNFAAAWWQGMNLREIDFTGWNTSNWTITSLGSQFCYCYNLERIDLDKWDTKNWGITTLASAFQDCHELKSLPIDKWNTSNWEVTTLASTWQSCYRLEELNLEGWDTSGWNITTLASTWYLCFSLKKLSISSWNTTNWHVTSLASTWDQCYRLLYTNLSKWNTSNWSVTNLSYAWRYNYARRDLKDIENWNTSSWAVTTLAYTWYSCKKLNSLDLTHWSTSNWKVTNLSYTWAYCDALLELKIGNWNISQWAPTSLVQTWCCCRRLKEWTASQWHTGAWEITSIDSTFRYCYSLKEINFSNWDCSAWALTTMAAFTSECRELEKLDMHNINISTITTANNYGSTSSTGLTTILYADSSLKIFNPPSGWKGRIYLNTAYSLPRSEIIKFFNNLVDNTGNTAIALYIAGERYKLTSADIAIATAKNYTIS